MSLPHPFGYRQAYDLDPAVSVSFMPASAGTPPINGPMTSAYRLTSTQIATLNDESETAAITGQAGTLEFYWTYPTDWRSFRHVYFNATGTTGTIAVSTANASGSPLAPLSNWFTDPSYPTVNKYVETVRTGYRQHADDVGPYGTIQFGITETLPFGVRFTWTSACDVKTVILWGDQNLSNSNLRPGWDRWAEIDFLGYLWDLGDIPQGMVLPFGPIPFDDIAAAGGMDTGSATVEIGAPLAETSPATLGQVYQNRDGDALGYYATAANVYATNNVAVGMKALVVVDESAELGPTYVRLLNTSHTGVLGVSYVYWNVVAAAPAVGIVATHPYGDTATADLVHVNQTGTLYVAPAVGHTQSTYGGAVALGSSSGGSSTGYTRWAYVSAAAAAGTSTRQIQLDGSRFDPAHVEIDVTFTSPLFINSSGTAARYVVTASVTAPGGSPSSATTSWWTETILAGVAKGIASIHGLTTAWPALDITYIASGWGTTRGPGTPAPTPAPIATVDPVFLPFIRTTTSATPPATPADIAIKYALSKLGDPYTWGATGPDTFDCSGLTMEAYHAAGITIGRTTYQQILDGIAVPVNQILPGDLVFPEIGHVQLAIGNGRVVEAPHTGAVIRIVAVCWGGTPIAVRRVSDPGHVVSQYGNFGDGSARTQNGTFNVWTGTPNLTITPSPAGSRARFQPRAPEGGAL